MQILVETVEYLGHVVNAASIRVDPAKVLVVQQWPAPTNVRELQAFLGLANYYRKFVPHFARQAAPLTDLLQHERSWQWTEREEQAFGIMKKLLTTAPVLSYPDYEKPFIVTADVLL